MSEGIVVKEEFPTGFHPAFGRMVVWFARIEYLMKVVHLRLGGATTSEAMLDAASGEQFGRQCRELQARFDARIADPMQRLAMAKVLAKLPPLFQYRDDCVHCCWRAEKDAVVGIRPSVAGGKVEWRAHRTSADKMGEVANALATIYVALDELTKLAVPANEATAAEPATAVEAAA